MRSPQTSFVRRCACPSLRADAGFSSGDNLTALIELGYEVEAKSADPAILAALPNRVTEATVWTPVGRNAEMVGWTGYQSHTWAHALACAMGLERARRAS